MFPGEWTTTLEGSVVICPASMSWSSRTVVFKRFFQGVSKILGDGRHLELAYIEAFSSPSALGTSPRLDTEVEFGDNETVVCPAFRTSHSLGNTDVLSVPLPDDDMVNEMPVL